MPSINVAAEGFDWDAGNLDKCRKHGLTIDQIEHVVGHAETLIVRECQKLDAGRAIHRSRTNAGGPLCFRGLHVEGM